MTSAQQGAICKNFEYLPEPTRALFLEGCSKKGIRNSEKLITPAVCEALRSLRSEEDQRFALHRSFLLLPESNQQEFILGIIRGLQSEKSSYLYSEGDWSCSFCGLKNSVSKAYCGWRGCEGAQQGSPLVPPPDVRNASVISSTPCKRFMEKGRCFYGDKCHYSHGENDQKRPILRVGEAKNGFEGLAPDLQADLLACFATYGFQPDILALCVYDSITEFPYHIQKELVGQFCAEDLSRVSNKTGYFIGIIKKFRKQLTERPGDENFSGKRTGGRDGGGRDGRDGGVNSGHRYRSRSRSPRYDRRRRFSRSPPPSSSYSSRRYSSPPRSYYRSRSPHRGGGRRYDYSPPRSSSYRRSHSPPRRPYSPAPRSYYDAAASYAAPRPSFDSSPEVPSAWYYTDLRHVQKGPSSLVELRTAWERREMDGSCLAWNDTMSDWKQISTLPSLMDFLHQPQTIADPRAW